MDADACFGKLSPEDQMSLEAFAALYKVDGLGNKKCRASFH